MYFVELFFFIYYELDKIKSFYFKQINTNLFVFIKNYKCNNLDTIFFFIEKNQ
jgi:hypothetical protein